MSSERPPCFRSGIWFKDTQTAILQFNDHRTYRYPNISESKWMAMAYNIRGTIFNNNWRWLWEHEELEDYPGDPNDADDCFKDDPAKFPDPHTDPQPDPPCKNTLDGTFLYQMLDYFHTAGIIGCSVWEFRVPVPITHCEIPATHHWEHTHPMSCDGIGSKGGTRWETKFCFPPHESESYMIESIHGPERIFPAGWDNTGWFEPESAVPNSPSPLWIKTTCNGKTPDELMDDAVADCLEACPMEIGIRSISRVYPHFFLTWPCSSGGGTWYDSQQNRACYVKVFRIAGGDGHHWDWDETQDMIENMPDHHNDLTESTTSDWLQSNEEDD